MQEISWSIISQCMKKIKNFAVDSNIFVCSRCKFLRVLKNVKFFAVDSSIVECGRSKILKGLENVKKKCSRPYDIFLLFEKPRNFSAYSDYSSMYRIWLKQL